MELRNSVFDARSSASSEIRLALPYKKANPSPMAMPPAIAAALFELNDVVGIAIWGIAVSVSVPLLVVTNRVVEDAVLR